MRRTWCSTSRRCWPIISGVMTLEPGDLVLTGTPAGVGTLSAGRRGRSRGRRREPGEQPCHQRRLVPTARRPILHASRVSARDDPAEEAGAAARGRGRDRSRGRRRRSRPRRRPRSTACARPCIEPAMSRYGFGLGYVAVSRGVSAWMQKRFGVRFDPFTEIVPLIGSKEGISHLALRVPRAGRRRDHSRAGLQRVSGRNAARERRAVSLSRCGRARTSCVDARRDPARRAAIARGSSI